MGHLPEALQTYRASLAIADRLAGSDPGNAGWQRDLSASYDRVGEVQKAQRHLPEALASYQVSLTIGSRLAKADSSNARWQHDVSVTYAKIADAFLNLSDLRKHLRPLSPVATSSHG